MSLQSPLRFYLLGNFRVENDEGVVKLATKPTAALLAYLVLHRNTWHERAQLATLFWGSEAAHELRRRVSDESVDKLARTSFRKALSSLRKQFGAEFILDSDDGKKIQINPDAEIWTDTEEFKATVNSQPSTVERNQSFDSAQDKSLVFGLSLYRGDLLQEFLDDPDSPWLDTLREKYREQFVQACLSVAQYARERGEWARVLEYAEMAHARDAYNETAVQHLMVAYARQGDTARALRTYSELERVLFQEVGSAPSNSTRALRRHIERNAARPQASALSNLPTPLTPFLGRETELEKIRALLQTARLVTLVGTGGSGKTRLAIHLAREAIGKNRDGVWWIRLEELDKDTGSVAQSIAQVLSVRGDAGRAIIETMCEQLRDSEMLLVLDNCEHLLADCARVCEQLLNACPQIKILATSRERLHIAGEVIFNVPSLPLPGERAQIATLEKSEAIKFFLHYARFARGDFALRETNAPSIAQICRRLDGIPLALELAAARVKTLSAEYIAEHLDERFELLSAQHRTIARHQTLRAVLDWSYELLDDAEKRVFAALSVFAARFTLDAAQYVVNGDGTNARDILEGLADKSLVLVEFDANDAVRYRLLETIREYAREKLAASPEQLAATNERLSKYYLQFSQQHAKNYLAIEDEWNNIATGMSIAHERQDWQPLLDYGQSVTDALFARGLYTDARRIIPWVITAADREEEQERSLEAMYKWGNSYIEQSLYDDARTIMQRVVDLSEMARDDKGMGFGFLGIGRVELEQSHYPEASANLEQALTYRQKIGDALGSAEILLEASRISFRQRQNQLAREQIQQAVEILRVHPSELLLIYGLQKLALIELAEQHYDRAEVYCREGIELCHHIHNRDELAVNWNILAQIMEARGEWQHARKYYESSREVYESLEMPKDVAYLSDALGGLLAKMGLVIEAETEGRAALSLLLKLNDASGIIAAQRRLGITLQQMNRLEEACALWQDALERAHKISDMRIPYLENLLETYCLEIKTEKEHP